MEKFDTQWVGLWSAVSREESYWQTFRWFTLSRVIISLMLLLSWLTRRSVIAQVVFPIDRFGWVVGLYFLFSLFCMWISGRIDHARKKFQGVVVVQAITDVLVLWLAMWAAPELRVGLSVLLVVFVAGSSVLLSRRLSCLLASIATLFFLGGAAWSALRGVAWSVTLVSSALFGMACFFTAISVNWLASRLRLQEAALHRQEHQLRQQLTVTSHVIAELPQGVVVLSQDGRIRLVNSAAFSMLGLGEMPDEVASAKPTEAKAPLFRGRWPDEHPLLLAYLRWKNSPLLHAHQDLVLSLPVSGWRSPDHDFAAMRDSEDVLPLEAAEAKKMPGQQEAASLRLRLRFLGVPAEGQEVVVLIEDQRKVEERAQELKLASMGRLSASIAHEVRNPLAVIRQANGLLGERLREESLQGLHEKASSAVEGALEGRVQKAPHASLAEPIRWVQMIEQNVRRIDRIVEDVLSLARPESLLVEQIDLKAFLPSFLSELELGFGVLPGRIETIFDSDQRLVFDVNHLEQVLCNIVTNALRYASEAAGAIRVEWTVARPFQRSILQVVDDGPGLKKDALGHLFEPFFTMDHRGNGLGLYLARTLCLANGANLRYFPPTQGRGNSFVIEPMAGDRYRET